MGGKCDGQFQKKLLLKKIHFIEQNIIVSEKLNYRKMFVYLLCTTLSLMSLIDEKVMFRTGIYMVNIFSTSFVMLIALI